MIDVLEKNLNILNIFGAEEVTHKAGTFDFTSKNGSADCFMYVSRGRVECIFNDRLIIAEEGDIVYLPKNVEYVMTILQPAEMICVDFEFHCDEDRMPWKQNCPNIMHLFSKLDTTYRQKGLAYFAKSMSVLYDIYGHLVLTHSGKTYLHSEQLRKLYKFTDSIVKNSHDPDLNITEEIAKTGMSESSFRYIFKRHFLTSPKQYLLNIRIEYAKELLRSTDETIEHIAFKSGFNDAAYFGKILKAAPV